MTEDKKYSISIVVPAYNEEEYLRPTVEELEPILSEIAKDWEIIIVDDASTDNTPVIARELAKEYEQVRIITNEKNLKLGGTLKKGYYAARYDLICYIDADLPFDFFELKRAIRYMKRCDMLCAYRLDRTAEGLKRVIYSYVYNFLISLLFHTSIRDINFSFKMFHRRILDEIELESEGSFIDAELIIKAERLGYTIYQIGVDFFPRHEGKSTLASLPVILKIIKEMVSGWFKLVVLKK